MNEYALRVHERRLLHIADINLVSQLLRIFIAVLFLRYVVFEDPKKALHEAGQRKKKVIVATPHYRQETSANPLYYICLPTTASPKQAAPEASFDGSSRC